MLNNQFQDPHYLVSEINIELKKIIEDYHVDPKLLSEIADTPNNEHFIYSPQYGIADLIEFYYSLENIINKSKGNLQDIFKILSDDLAGLFRSKYVEFMLLKDNYLEYSYITIPEWLTVLTNRIAGITSIIGMKIPLFENSMYTDFIKSAKPREIISYKDRLKSFRDFLEPNTKENVFKRDYIAPILMPFFAYNYIFQIPLIINNKIFGFFSFLQKGGFSERVKADIIMLSGKIANLIAMKKIDEERRNFCKKISQPAVILDVIPSYDFKEYEYNISEANDGFLTIVMSDREKIINKSFAEFIPDQSESLNYLFHSVYTTGKTEIVDIHYKISQKIFRSAVSKTENDNIMIIGEDVTEKTKLAEYDELTEIYNRHTFIEKCDAAIRDAGKNNTMVALFFIDLNSLKPVNDMYGHEVGDVYLCKVAMELKSALRKIDIIGRYGGDEFTVLSAVSDREDAEKIAEKISSAIKSLRIKISGEGIIEGSASIGIAFPARYENIADLIRKSDKAMYMSKKKNIPFCFFDSIAEN